MKKWTLPEKVHKYIYKKDINKALGFLSKIAALNQTGLFTKGDEGYLRYVGFFRIQLLMEWGYYREALAWACLECELYPDNVNAFILKEDLKQKINNLPVAENISQIQSNNNWIGIAGMREVKAAVERDIILPMNNKTFTTVRLK